MYGGKRRRAGAALRTRGMYCTFYAYADIFHIRNILFMININVVLFGATLKVNPFLHSVYGHSCEIVKDNVLIENLKRIKQKFKNIT